MSETPIEIQCPGCGRETLLLRSPVYTGLTRTGEELSCAGCGHVFADESDVPYVQMHKPHVFSEDDRSAAVKVFEEHEAGRLCRYCRHYVINPFTQWCSRHRREVEATETCDQFDPAEKEGKEKKDPLGGC